MSLSRVRLGYWGSPGQDKQRYRLVDTVLVLWFVLLAVAIALVAFPLPMWAKVLGALIAAWRWIEAVLRALHILLAPPKPERALVSARRAFIQTLITVLQVWLLFIALDWFVTDVVSTSFADQGSKLHSFGHFAYLSWTTLLTMGSNYTVEGPWAEALVMLELGTGLLLIVATIGALVSTLHIPVAGK